MIPLSKDNKPCKGQSGQRSPEEQGPLRQLNRTHRSSQRPKQQTWLCIRSSTYTLWLLAWCFVALLIVGEGISQTLFLLLYCLLGVKVFSVFYILCYCVCLFSLGYLQFSYERQKGNEFRGEGRLGKLLSEFIVWEKNVFTFFLNYFISHPDCRYPSLLSSQFPHTHLCLHHPNPLLHCFCVGKDRFPISINKTWYIKLQ